MAPLSLWSQTLKHRRLSPPLFAEQRDHQPGKPDRWGLLRRLGRARMAGKNPLHFFSFYPRDFASDGAVEAMSTKAVGAYILLLCKAWFESPPGTLPDDDVTLAKWSRLSAKDWAEVKAEVMAAFKKSGDRWKQKRLAEEHGKANAKSTALSEAGRRGAEARYRPGHSQAMPAEQSRAIAEQKQKQINPEASKQESSAAGISLAARPPAQEVVTIMRKLWPRNHEKAYRIAQHPNASIERACWMADRIIREKPARAAGFMEKAITEGWDVPPEWVGRFHKARGETNGTLRIAGGAA